MARRWKHLDTTLRHTFRDSHGDPRVSAIVLWREWHLHERREPEPDSMGLYPYVKRSSWLIRGVSRRREAGYCGKRNM